MNQFIKAHLANGTTILGIILASDCTHLTNFTGDKKMHAVYLSIGNISKDVHWKHNSCTWLLVTKIPIPKFLKTQFSGPKTNICKHLNSELGLKLQGSDTEEKESWSNATNSANNNFRPGPLALVVWYGMKSIYFCKGG